MTKFRYGFMTKAHQPRLTPKSDFVRRLEANQKAKARKSTITVQVDLAKLLQPKPAKLIEVEFNNFDLREAA